VISIQVPGTGELEVIGCRLRSSQPARALLWKESREMHRTKKADLARPPQAYRWASARSVEIVQALNERCLQWLAQAAKNDASTPLEILRCNLDLWKLFDSRACVRAARTPVVLLDCNFTCPDWWTGVVGRGLRPVRPSGRQACFTAKDAGKVLREILTEARTIAVAEPRAAHLFFGAPSIGVDLLSTMSLADIDRIASEHVVELRPRWAERADFWRNLLLAGILGTDEAMSELSCHSLQLLGTEIMDSIASHARRVQQSRLASPRR
jgi:hypothetical protein